MTKTREWVEVEAVEAAAVYVRLNGRRFGEIGFPAHFDDGVETTHESASDMHSQRPAGTNNKGWKFFFRNEMTRPKIGSLSLSLYACYMALLVAIGSFFLSPFLKANTREFAHKQQQTLSQTLIWLIKWQKIVIYISLTEAHCSILQVCPLETLLFYEE